MKHISSLEGNLINRREFLKASAALLAATPLVPTAFGLEFGPNSMPPPSAEDIPGAIDLSLSQSERKSFENQWLEIEGKTKFDDFRDYLTKVTKLLNVTRARDLRGDDFINFVNQFIGTPVDIGGKSLSIVSQIQGRVVPELSHQRDRVFQGLDPSSLYGVRAYQLTHSLLLSYLNRIEDVEGPYNPLCIGETAPAFTTSTHESWGPSDLRGGSLNYLTHIYDIRGTLAKGVFDSRTLHPKEQLSQRDLTSLDDLLLGDTIFRDYTTGSAYGHPTVVVRTNRDQTALHLPVTDVAIQDMNIGGRMVAGTYDVNHTDVISSVIHENTPLASLGILRNTYPEADLHLQQVWANTIMSASDLPASLQEGRPEHFPDMSSIPELVSLWRLFAHPSERSRAIEKIVALAGLNVKDERGETTHGPRWQPVRTNYAWICNLYSTFLMRALGINDIGHWFVDGRPTDNLGEEYDVVRMHQFMNTRGREYNWHDVTYASIKTRADLLAKGNVMYVSAPFHTACILPIEGMDGDVIAGLSQAGFDRPLRAPEYAYKYLNPSALEDIDVLHGQGVVWAHRLPNVKGSTDEYTPLLFAHKMPLDNNPETSNKEGWLTSIKKLKEFIGDRDFSWYESLWNEVVDTHKEILPTQENSLFKYAFEVIKSIQQYPLPVGTPIEEDSSRFLEYFKRSLSELGYKRTINTDYARQVLDGVQAKFVTRELALLTNRAIQPIKCVGFAQLLDLGRGVSEWAPARAGGLSYGNAQDIAKTLLSLPFDSNLHSFVDSKTTAIHLPGDAPATLNDFQLGDSFFLAYSGESEGHVGVIVTDPFMGRSGETMIGVADANRIVYESDENGLIQRQVVADGMPRLRFMNLDQFSSQYLLNRIGERDGRLVILRSNKPY